MMIADARATMPVMPYGLQYFTLIDSRATPLPMRGRSLISPMTLNSTLHLLCTMLESDASILISHK